MPEISVIVPAYNVDKYIKKCMNSILMQTFVDFEVLLIDDGSKDSTSHICDEIQKMDQRVKVFHKRNGGLSDARNYGLDRINGKYITFIDSDDYVAKDYLETLYQLITLEPEVQVSILPGIALSEDVDPPKKEFCHMSIVETEQAIRKMLLRNEITHSSWGKLFDATLWKKVRFPLGKNYEDYATTYHVVSQANKVAVGTTKSYYYIQHENSIMHGNCSEKTLSVLDISDAVTDYLLNTWPNSRIEAIELQTITYLKNMQIILNLGMNEFQEYQERISIKVKNNARLLLSSRRVPIKDKFKIFSFLLGKKIFLKIYNKFDGDVKVRSKN